MTEWTPLIIAGLGLAAYLVRSSAPALSFMHNKPAQTAVSFVAGALGAVADRALSDGVHRSAAIMALAAFVTSFVRQGNPSIAKDGPGKLPGLKTLIPRLMLPLLLAGRPPTPA